MALTGVPQVRLFVEDQLELINTRFAPDYADQLRICDAIYSIVMSIKSNGQSLARPSLGSSVLLVLGISDERLSFLVWQPGFRRDDLLYVSNCSRLVTLVFCQIKR